MAIILAFILGAVAATLLTPTPPDLRGLGCAGTRSGSVLYADEEDEFPICLVIEDNHNG